MSFWLFLIFITVSALLVAMAYLLGFRLGGDSWLAEINRVRAESAIAERRLHDLTRQAFVAMAEETTRQRSGQ
jgi:hypothetical protein